MSSVLLIIQLVLSVLLTVLVLLQRSEGGALGIGGGGGGLMSGRSATTSIVKMTSFVGVLFIANCVALTIVFNMENAATSVLEQEDTSAPLTRTGDAPEDTVPTVEEIVGVDTPESETTPEPEAEPEAGDE